jgi:hypothetical protein
MVAGFLLSLVAASAVGEQAKPTQVKFSGFLGDYTELAPTNNSSEALLRYIDPAAPRSSDTAVRLDLVTF